MIAVEEFKAKVEAIGGPRMFRRSALSIRDGAGVIERVLSARSYRTVLEIGTYRGVTAAYMAQFCERVITIDLKRGRVERHGGEFDRQGFWKKLGINNIDLRLLRYSRDKAALIGLLEFDFAFIDGDHIAPGPAEDFALVRRCGTVLFHDYGGKNDVTAFVNKLPRKQIEVLDIFALWTE